MSQEEQVPPPSSGLASIFSEFLVVAGALVGIFLIFIGQIVLVYAMSNDVIQMSYVFRYLGGLFSSGALIGGGILNRHLDKFVRLGLLIAAGLMMASMLGLALR